MELIFRRGHIDELPIAINLLKQAAEMLKAKKVNQWPFWLNPSVEKLNWIKSGFENSEFYFVENSQQILVGMFRLLDNDELYWGKQITKANYIHSLVIEKSFSGQQLGKVIIKQIEQILIKKGVSILRLDCNGSNKKLCQYYELQNFSKVGEKQMPDSLNNLYEKVITKSPIDPPLV